MICNTLHKKLLAATLVEEFGSLDNDGVDGGVGTREKRGSRRCNCGTPHDDDQLLESTKNVDETGELDWQKA